MRSRAIFYVECCRTSKWNKQPSRLVLTNRVDTKSRRHVTSSCSKDSLNFPDVQSWTHWQTPKNKLTEHRLQQQRAVVQTFSTNTDDSRVDSKPLEQLPTKRQLYIHALHSAIPMVTNISLLNLCCLLHADSIA